MTTLIYIVLLAGAVIGFCQGAFKQIANFAGVIVGLILAVMLYERFGDMLADTTGTSESVGQTFAFILLVIIIPVLLGWAASLLTKLFQAIHLGFLNRLAGAAVGVLCYGLLMSIAFNMFDFVRSNCGFKPEKLEERPAEYYLVKHASQLIVPDVLIVTDATEIDNGAEPRFGLKQSVDNVVGILPSML